MSEASDSLIRLRLMVFDRNATDMSRATSRVIRAHELLAVKKNSADSIGKEREAISNELQVMHDAHWFANSWAFDRRLAGDLELAREEVSRTENILTGRKEELLEKKRALALAQAKLNAAHNLNRRRRRASSRRRERRMEEEVSGFRTGCL